MPVDPTRFLAFLGAMAVLAATPGPANLYAIATGVQRGREAALLGVAGMNTATLVWFAGAALGLSALIIAFPAAFGWVAIAGGLYVAWLGAKALMAAVTDKGGVAHAPLRPVRHAFRDGFAVQISNPKALLFFTAVLPPFLDVARPLLPQLALFAAATIALDVIAMTAYGVGGAALAARFERRGFRRAFQTAVGCLLLAAAALILLRH